MGHAITPSATRSMTSANPASASRKTSTPASDSARASRESFPALSSEEAATVCQTTDQLARACIKSACQPVRSGGRTWYDTTAGFDDQEAVDIAYTWLLSRGTALNSPMVCCLAFPRLVKFEEKTE